MDTGSAIERFLASGGLSESTQRAYGWDLSAFASWLQDRSLELDDVDTRVLADYVAELGRGRARLAPTSGIQAPRR